jgi:hypothetical protein
VICFLISEVDVMACGLDPLEVIAVPLCRGSLHCTGTTFSMLSRHSINGRKSDVATQEIVHVHMLGQVRIDEVVKLSMNIFPLNTWIGAQRKICTAPYKSTLGFFLFKDPIVSTARHCDTKCSLLSAHYPITRARCRSSAPSLHY